MLIYILIAYLLIGLGLTFWAVARSKTASFDWNFFVSLAISIFLWPFVYGGILYSEFRRRR